MVNTCRLNWIITNVFRSFLIGGIEFVIVCCPVGNLALSRALGDFCFKKNDKKSAEEQIVTGTVNL